MKSKKLIAVTVTFCMMLSLGSASLVHAGSGNTAFADVPDDYWAKTQIDYFAQQGIVSGYTDGTFKPNAGVTREEFCKLLVSTFNQPLETPSTPTFADVEEGRWSYPYIEVCSDFLTGYANPFGGLPSFHPSEYATREDIAVALVRMMGYTDSDASDKDYAVRRFGDGSSISPNLAAYVSIACEKGLISGYPDGTFGPSKGITRAETVVLLNRATKQAVTNINAELVMDASVIYSKDGKTATVNIKAEEGTSVTVNDTYVEMNNNYQGKFEGSYVHKFEDEGSVQFVVKGERGGKKKTVNLSAEYKVGTPILTIDACPTMTDKKTVTIKGSVSDPKDSKDDLHVSVNGSEVSYYYGNWSKEVKLTEGENTITIIATNSMGKTKTETRTIIFSVGAPTLTVTSCPTSSDKKTATIKGNVSDTNDNNGDINITINGSAVNNSHGSWIKEVELKEGANTFTIVATNSLGKSATEVRTITFGVDAPTLNITTCPTTTDKKTVTIKGNVSDKNDNKGDINITINGSAVNNSYGNWSKDIELGEGENTITIVATNSLGKSTTETRVITFGVGAPTLKITTCPTTTDKKTVTIKGNVTDANDNNGDIVVTINGSSVNNAYGGWSKEVELTEGENTFTIVATNSLGKSTTETRIITFGVGAPTLKITSCPTTSSKKTATIKGTVSDVNDNRGDINITINGSSVNNSYGNWSKDVELTEGENTFTIVATNSLGKSATETRTISFGVGAPTIAITVCPTTSETNKVTIKGTVSDENDNKGDINVTINGTAVNNSYGNWNKEITLEEGANTITIVATNSLGKSTTETRRIDFKAEAPEIQFTNCPEETTRTSLTIKGKIKGGNKGAMLFVNDGEVNVNSSGEFSETVTLTEGENTFVFRAVNEYGKEVTVTKKITCNVK